MTAYEIVRIVVISCAGAMFLLLAAAVIHTLVKEK